jgi:hypothetical protein
MRKMRKTRDPTQVRILKIFGALCRQKETGIGTLSLL